MAPGVDAGRAADPRPVLPLSAVASEDECARAGARLLPLRETLRGALLGQETLIDHAVVGLLARGHMLLEGLPGLGKTMLVKALARALGLPAKRIQFTPDLLPGDITGNPILEDEGGHRRLVFHPGPIFASLVLADEINRASPRTQSALLEAMQERSVTVLGETRELPEPFFVLATQNPIELEGTYPLPEAQLDRFLFKLEVRRGSLATLERIVKERDLTSEPDVPLALSREELLGLMATARRVHLPDVVAGWIARLIDATHPGRSKASSGVRYGASPRAALGLAAGARARALALSRMNASFEDVRALAHAVLDHRLVLDHRARLDGRTAAQVTDELLREIEPTGVSLPSTLRPAQP